MTARARGVDGEGAPLYDLYGLRVRSEAPLPAAPASADGPIDLELRLAEPCEQRSPAAGRVLAEFDPGGGGYVLTDEGSSRLFRVWGVCDVVVHGAVATVHPHPRAPRDLVAIVLAGPVLGGLAALGGEFLLHASAVERDGVALAIAGGTGAGKTTLAGLLVARGGRLVTDDVLGVRFDGAAPRGLLGTRTLRLREGAWNEWIATEIGRFETTADQRIGVRAPHASARPVLGAVVVPSVTDSATRPSLRRLAHAEALRRLLGSMHVIGWRDERPIRTWFAGIARVARELPVYAAELPATPPSADAIVELLWSALLPSA